MNAPSKIDDLVALLNQKTQEGKLNWQKTNQEATFLAPLGKRYFTIAKDDLFSVDYQLGIVGTDGNIIERFSGSPKTEIGVKLGNLYELARNKALNIDGTIEELKKQLEGL